MHFCARASSDSIRKRQTSACHLCFCKIASLVTDNHIVVGSFWHVSCVLGRRAPVLIVSLPLTSFGHHLITEQGRSQCFLVGHPPPSGHHLMMKNLLREIWAFVLLSFFFLFAMELRVCVRPREGCFCTPPAYFWWYILLSGLKFDILSPGTLFVYFTLSATVSHIGSVTSTLNQSSPPLKMVLQQSWSKGKERFSSGHTSSNATKDKTPQRHRGELWWDHKKPLIADIFAKFVQVSAGRHARQTEMAEAVMSS